MNRVRLQSTLIVLIVVCGGISNAGNKRERQCCGYSMNSSQSSYCEHLNGCIVMSAEDGKLWSGNNVGNNPSSYKTLPLEQCQITADSKLLSNNYRMEKDNKSKCLVEQFNGEDIRQAQVLYGIIYGSKQETIPEVKYESHPNIEIDNSIPLPFSIHPYILIDPKATELPALEVRVANSGAPLGHPTPSQWSQLRFRILNRNHCAIKAQDLEANPALLDSCLPRCVSVEQMSNNKNSKEEKTENANDMGTKNIGS